MYGDFISVTATQWAFRNSKSKGVARNVLLAICAGCNTDFFSWPSIDTLMQFANCTRVTVMKSLEELLSIKEIEYESGGGAGKTNRYHLTAFANSISEQEKPSTTVQSTHETVHPGIQEEVEEVKSNNREEVSCPGCINANFKHDPDCPQNPRSMKRGRANKSAFQKSSRYPSRAQQTNRVVNFADQKPAWKIQKEKDEEHNRKMAAGIDMIYDMVEEDRAKERERIRKVMDRK